MPVRVLSHHGGTQCRHARARIPVACISFLHAAWAVQQSRRTGAYVGGGTTAKVLVRAHGAMRAALGTTQASGRMAPRQ